MFLDTGSDGPNKNVLFCLKKKKKGLLGRILGGHTAKPQCRSPFRIITLDTGLITPICRTAVNTNGEPRRVKGSGIQGLNPVSCKERMVLPGEVGREKIRGNNHPEKSGLEKC